MSTPHRPGSADGGSSPRNAGPRPTSLDAAALPTHVRFSTDEPRQPPLHHRMAHDDITEETTENVREGPLEIESLDPREEVTLPMQLEAPRTTSIPRLPSSSASSGNRKRGYSLRRQLFFKQAQNDSLNPASHGSSDDLELEAVPKPAPLALKPEVGTTRQVEQPRTKQSSPKWTAIRNWVVFHYQETRKTILRLHPLPPTKEGRKIRVDLKAGDPGIDERTGKRYVGNSIRSSRYTLWSFLPKQLISQFSQLANFYFLVIAILQLIPGLSTTGTYTMIVPLLIFVSFAMGKEGYDDYRRYKLDKVENNSDAQILRPGNEAYTSESWETIKWEDVRVGDIVRLGRDDWVPADMVLLHCDGLDACAFIETIALDGETNLKTKQALPSIAEQCDTMEHLSTCKVDLVVEDPNTDLYNFEGHATVDGDMKPLTSNHIVYRGSVLRNTNSVLGVVIFSGEECKIRMNANKNPRTKAPTTRALLNKIIITIIFFVLGLAFFCTAGYQVWKGIEEHHSWYLNGGSVAFFPILASYIILFNTLIPLSLYVSLEIVKLFQIFFLRDVDMYHAESDTPFEAHTSTINEDCGNISYIFSDKTGTLTDNFMLFRKLSVAGLAWLHGLDIEQEAAENSRLVVSRLERKKAAGKGKGRKDLRNSLCASGQKGVETAQQPRISYDSATRVSPLDRRLSRLSTTSSRQWRSPAHPKKEQPQMSTYDLLEYLHEHPNTYFAEKARFFLLAIALCHTALPETHDDGSTTYQASSPDEVALVQAAQEMGYIAIDRQIGSIRIKTYPNGPEGGETVDIYEILDVIEFSSRRKRMSILIRMPSGKICVFSKGADSTMVELLRLKDLAVRKVREVERRASQRRSLEANEAMRRMSMHRDGINGAPSISSAARPSFAQSNSTRPSIDQLDGWLRDKEEDVEMPSIDNESIYSRPSGQFGVRASIAGVPELVVDDSIAENEDEVFERCFAHINDFATEGLRTLLYCHRFMEEADYLRWKGIYVEATTSLVDRQAMIERAADLIEKDFELTGATAIEDKLQKGVPEAIEKLRRAGIKLWMLTGDKRETAINIAHSCRLIKDYSHVTILDESDEDLADKMRTTIAEIEAGNIAHSVVVVDGGTLATFDDQPVLADLFFSLAVITESVICCRASPSQKQMLVRSIRKKVKKSVTLAIGDGANDIAMIQEAHVGIGITGKEGLQAARVSDYSMAQFRFLLKFLLVHGRWNYIRTCKYVLGTFWKEFMFYLTQMIFQRWVGFTGTSLYESWSISTYNTLFTSLPIIMLGIIDKELEQYTLLAVPELYKKGQKQTSLNFKRVIEWITLGIFYSAINYFMVHSLYMPNITVGQDLYAMGDIAFTVCVIVVSIKLYLIELRGFSHVALYGFLWSIGGWFLWNLIISGAYDTGKSTYNVRGNFIHHFGRDLNWWLVVLLSVLICCILDMMVKSTRGIFWPSETDTFRAIQEVPELRQRLIEEAKDNMPYSYLFYMQESGKNRDGEVQDLLNAPRWMEEGMTGKKSDSSAASEGTEEELHVKIARWFGAIIHRRN